MAKMSDSIRVTRRKFMKASAATGAALAAGSVFAPAAHAAKTFKIGYVSPQTGPLAAFAEADNFVISNFLNTVKDGVKVGGATLPVEVAVKDSQSNPNRAAEVAKELIVSNKIDLMLVASTPETTNPVATQCEIEEVPCISTVAPWQPYFIGRQANPGGGPPAWKPFNYTYHFFWGLEDVIAVFTNMWGQLQTNKSVGGLFPNDGDGNAWMREDPADAEVPSHRLLVRAGYIRRVSPGIYTWLPLGLRVLRNIERIVREEMDQISQELLFPALLPREPFDASGRWTEYGDNIFRLRDRKGADHLLGPTHEELFTLAVKDLFSSYRDLPVSLYQIQTKYRDEARPRAGLLRGREFVMKDSYSFDIDAAGLAKSYDAHRDAYIKIFDRLGFHYVIVQAMAGAMGGSKSEEFLATAENGEDTYVRCPHCGYAANVEAVRVPVPEPLPLAGPAPQPGGRHARAPRRSRRSSTS